MFRIFSFIKSFYHCTLDLFFLLRNFFCFLEHINPFPTDSMTIIGNKTTIQIFFKNWSVWLFLSPFSEQCLRRLRQNPCNINYGHFIRIIIRNSGPGIKCWLRKWKIMKKLALVFVRLDYVRKIQGVQALTG